MKVRLKDVAARAGVAVNTASMILNRRSNSWASKATEERVHQAAKDLDYQPSRAAVALRLGKYNTIGAIVPDLQNPYFSRMAELLEDEVAEKGYDLVLESSRCDLAREGKCLRSIFERQVDGVICFLLDNERHRDFLIERSARGQAIVGFAEATGQELPVDTVAVSFLPGIGEAFALLTGAGHRRIAYILALAEGQAEGDRPQAFRDLVHRLGVDSEDMSIASADPSIQGAHETALRLLRRTENRPTAILAHNDLAALGAMRAASDLGLRVPQDLSVIGVDDTKMGEYLPVALTSVGLPDRKMAREAVDLLIRRLENATYAGPQRTVFSTRLIVRESTGPAPE